MVVISTCCSLAGRVGLQVPQSPPPRGHPVASRHCFPLGQHGNSRRGQRCRAASFFPLEDAETWSDTVDLGGSGLKVSAMGLGTRCWGDTEAGFGSAYDEEDLSLVFEAAIAEGCTFFDTDEVYGYQSIAAGKQAEQLLGRLKTLWMHPSRPAIVLGTKYSPLPWANRFVGGDVRSGKASMAAALQASLDRLGLQQVDVWQVQFPIEGQTVSYMEGLCEAVQKGQVAAVGVCNYNAAQLEEALEVAAKFEVPVACNQVRYSVFHREPEHGMLELCSKAGVAVVAHSPLDGRIGQGAEGLGQEEAAVVKLLEFIGAVGYKGRTATQVAINYLMCKGAIPVPGCTKVPHAEELLGAIGWRLEADDIAIIDEKLTYHGF